jgi:hypothetical protein
MAVTVTTPSQLGEALKDDVDEIEVVGELKTDVIKIKDTSDLQWKIAIGAIVASAGLVITGLGLPLALLSGGAAVAIIGAAATGAAIKMGVAAGDPRAVQKLREYSMEEKGESLVLRNQIAPEDSVTPAQ